jgi:hypothetical protein
MNLVKSRAIALALVAAAATLAACDKKPGTRTALAPSPSAQVVGTVPAPPSASEPAGVTPVAPNTTYITKQVESTEKPQEGDNHSYSTTAHVTPQKAGYVDPVQAPERKKE